MEAIKIVCELNRNQPAVVYASESHAGGRTRNEDTTFTPSAEQRAHIRGQLFAVADGMGGHQGGGLASRLACQGLEYYYKGRLPEALGRSDILTHHLNATILRIDKSIRLYGRTREELSQMGTTLSCLVLAHPYSIIAHVGDSRVYRLRRGYLTCLTTDHTFVQEMIFEGHLAPEKAASHPLRHLLTRAVGTQETLEWVDSRIDPAFAGDRFLLSTDGLHTVLSADRMAAVLGSPWGVRRIAAQLVTEALKAGAKDNISVIVICLSA
jgi:PPM family protein phosphatase